MSPVVVDDLDLEMRLDAPDRRDAPLDRIVAGALEADRARLGHAVGDRHLAHVHLVDHLPHHLDRAGRAGHDAGPQRGEIEAVEFRMLEHGDEHGRHAVERGAALGLDRLSAATGSKPSEGLTIAAPWVTQARLPSTMPKQW